MIPQAWTPQAADGKQLRSCLQLPQRLLLSLAQRPGMVFDASQKTLLVERPLRSCLQCSRSAVSSPFCAEAGLESDASLVAQQLRQQQLRRQVLAAERRAHARDSSVERSLSPSRAGSMQLVRLCS